MKKDFNVRVTEDHPKITKMVGELNSIVEVIWIANPNIKQDLIKDKK